MRAMQTSGPWAGSVQCAALGVGKAKDTRVELSIIIIIIYAASVTFLVHPAATLLQHLANMIALKPTVTRCPTTFRGRMLAFTPVCVAKPQRIAAVKKAAPQAPQTQSSQSLSLLATPAALLTLLSSQPALADTGSNPFAGVQSNSLYVTMALFLMCVPGGLID
jgi:hypothetical protein